MLLRSMDEPDASHGVSDLLDRFIAVQLHELDSVKCKARLKRIAFTFLLGLDTSVEVLDSVDDPNKQKLALSRAILNLHRSGRGQEAHRLENLFEELQRVSPVSDTLSTSIVHSDPPPLDNAEILQLLLCLQGSVDKGERWRSNGAKGTLTEQLQTMHQPLDTTQESGACSRLPQASTGNGASVMQLMSTMARKPHWQKGKLGQPLPPAARDTLLSGADLLRTMESQPETSKPMWEVDSSDENSDSGSDQDYSSSSPVAYAAPCMTIGAGTYGPGYLNTQGSLQSAARLKAHNAAAAGHVVWGRQLIGGSKTDEGDLARAALLAMQGVVPATVFLDRADLETHELGHASLSKFITPIVNAGKLRAILDAFLADMSAYSGSPGTSAGPCLQGFAAVAQHMLRAQTSALQSVPSAVRARRLDELLYCDSKLTPGALQQDQAYLNIISSPDDVTILEVSMHTRGLQAELAVLGSLCGFSQDSEVLPEWTADGLELLENLHRQLTTAELRSAPLLQRLFQGAYQPFGEALAEWLFHGEARPHPNSPFAAELPSDLRDLLPERCQPEACTIALPGFLQPWRRQIRVAGLQLRLLHGLPAPWCQLAADLSSAAAAEAAERRKASGTRNIVNSWSEADAVSDMFLTFDSLSLAKVAAIQEQGQMARNGIVTAALHSLEPTPSSEQSPLSHAQRHAAKQDVPAEHAAEHAVALQTVSKCSSEQRAHEQSYNLPSEAALAGNSQDEGAANSAPAAQARKNGRWPCAKPLPKPGSPAAKLLPELGSPVPSETDMSRQPAVHDAAMPRRNGNSHGADGSLGAVSIGQQSRAAVAQPPSGRQDRSCSWQGCSGSPAADAYDSSLEANEDAPLPAVLEALVLRRVHAQYACTSRACLGCLQALQLPATLQAIQSYFFMGAGDWADALVSAFCSAGPSLEPHSLHACHSMLGTALQASAMAEDPFGSLLRIRSSMPSSRGGVLPKRGCSLQLQLELSWPLTAFLPPAVMQECNMVFEELLGLRSMCWRLARTWLDCCHHPGVHVDGTEALAEQRLRMLRAFRAAAAQLLDALLRHMLQGLHGPSLATVLLELQGSADVLAARDTITAWSNAAMQACLLHKDCQAEAQLLRPVLDAIGGCLDAIVVCMTACDDSMAAAVLSFHVWEGLQRAIQKFEGEMHALARHMKDRTQSKLQNLLVPMLVNDYWVQQPQ